MSLATLTITVYMIVQGIAPLFWGSFSDVIGRRPVFIGTFIVYLAANIALGLSDNYVELLMVRGLQAAGSAATISIGEDALRGMSTSHAADFDTGAGVIGDISTSAERGGLVGIFSGSKTLSLPNLLSSWWTVTDLEPKCACSARLSDQSSEASSHNTWDTDRFSGFSPSWPVSASQSF